MLNKFEFRDSDVHSLSEYLDSVREIYIKELYIGGKLQPFNIQDNFYRWVLFPVDLVPGYYRLCLMIVSDWQVRPLTAYAMIFTPGEKIKATTDPHTLGYGFQITPAIASGNQFFLSRNITDFTTRYSGVHQIGVTTTYWTDDAADTCFEILLLRKKQRLQYLSFN